MQRFFSSKAAKPVNKLGDVPKVIKKIKSKDSSPPPNGNPWSPPWLKWKEIKSESRKSQEAKEPAASEAKEEPVTNLAFTLDSDKVELTPVEADTPQVPPLANGVDRALFNPGVQFLKDPRTNVYNFTPKIEEIMSIRDFDFTCVPKYVPSGSDNALSSLAQTRAKTFTGSTSSLTPLLVKIHMALSNNRPPQTMNLSKFFPNKTTTFSSSQRGPVSFFLKYHPETKTYSVGADDSDSDDIILTLLGQTMEKMLVTDADTFALFDKRKSHAVPPELKEDTNAYHYSECGNFVMRSQLDCYDSRLPGTGMFDLKTRAVCAVRYDIDYAQIHDGSHYQLLKRDGFYESYAREFYELIRTTMFKYSLQARIGRMDGIFIAYHNISTLFGFEYLPLSEIDKIFHTSHLVTKYTKKSEDLDEQMQNVASYIAENEFKLSMDLLSKLFKYILKRVSSDQAREALNMVLHCPDNGELIVFVKPMLTKDIGAAPETVVQDENYKMGQDPATVLQHWSGGRDFVPPDILAYKISLTSYVSGKPVPKSAPPKISPGDAWTVRVGIDELEGEDLKKAYEDAMSKHCSQIVTSTPLTERYEDEEELRRVALSKLPSPSALQQTLRKLNEKGQRYKMWDQARDKIWNGES